MAGKNKKKKTSGNTVAQNRRARHDYEIIDTMEAGIVLMGSEVKSLRQGHASIGEAFAQEQNGEMFLVNAHIPEYAGAAEYNGHKPRRPRKLLLHRREINRLANARSRDGMSVVPLSIFFTQRGLAKVSLALGRGKKKIDKRHDIKDRDWKRQQSRLMREKG
ncbi:MAG: SsrA-binding protein SmpB [Magnetovibrionaceae bacterium]